MSTPPSFEDYYRRRYGNAIVDQGLADHNAALGGGSGLSSAGAVNTGTGTAPTGVSAVPPPVQTRPLYPPPPPPGSNPPFRGGGLPGTGLPDPTNRGGSLPNLPTPTASPLVTTPPPGLDGVATKALGAGPSISGRPLPGGGTAPGAPTNNQGRLDQLRNNRPLYGSMGIEGSLTGRPQFLDENQGQSGMYEQYVIGNGGDAGMDEYGFRLKPQWVNYFRDRYGWDVEGNHGYPVQLGREGFDANRIRDMSQVVYDDQLGLITFDANVTPEEDNYGQDLFRVGGLALGGLTGLHAMGFNWDTMAFSGSGVGAGGEVSAPGGGPTGGEGTPTPAGGPGGGPGGGPTLMEPLQPLPPLEYTPIAPDPSILSGGGGLGGGLSLGNVARGAGALNSIFNGGGGGPNGGGPGGGGPGGRGGPGGSIFDLFGIGAGAYNNNSIFNRWRDDTNDLINRGDWNPNRAEYMERLRQFMLNPQAALEDQGYKDLRARAEEDMSRKMAARGMNLSGNELGDLTQLRTEMDYKQISSERDQLMKAAGLGDPRDMIGNALRNLPQLYNMRNNNDAGTFAAANRWLQQNLPGLAAKGIEYVNQFINWLNGSGSMPSGGQDFLNQLAQQSGLPPQTFLEHWRQGGGAHEWGGDSDGPPADWSDWSGDDWYNWIFGGG